MSFPRNSPCGPNRPRTDRGSAVITVLVLAAVTAVIASGFLFRSAQEARLATRSFFQSAALNLAEAGIEEAIFAVNTNSFDSDNGWALVSGSTTDFTKSITSGFDFQQATGAVYIRVDAAVSASPTITAAGVITIPNQPKLLKQVYVGGAAPARIWGNSIVSKGDVTFNGSAEIDSYDSNLGPWNAATNRSDRATVATNATVQVSGSAEIYGYVATGGAPPVVGAGGRIYSSTSPGTPLVDPTRVRTDFNANLADATAPTSAATSLGAYAVGSSTTVVLPRVGDTLGDNGRYIYSATSFDLSGSCTVRIDGPVDIIVSGNLNIGGTASLTVGGGSSATPSLNLYCAGDINMGGSGMVNSTSKPINASIWGTKPAGSTQNISLGGSSAFIGTLYAPNGNISQSGSTDIYGAVIGKSVTLSGGCQFHYDVQLEQATSSGGPTPLSGTGNGYLRVRRWNELKSAPGSGNAFARDNRTPFDTLF